jgi:hypothetical protein
MSSQLRGAERSTQRGVSRQPSVVRPLRPQPRSPHEESSGADERIRTADLLITSFRGGVGGTGSEDGKCPIRLANERVAVGGKGAGVGVNGVSDPCQIDGGEPEPFAPVLRRLFTWERPLDAEARPLDLGARSGR